MTEYKRLGDYIRPVDVRNRDMASTPQAPHKYPTSWGYQHKKNGSVRKAC